MEIDKKTAKEKIRKYLIKQNFPTSKVKIMSALYRQKMFNNSKVLLGKLIEEMVDVGELCFIESWEGKVYFLPVHNEEDQFYIDYLSDNVQLNYLDLANTDVADRLVNDNIIGLVYDKGNIYWSLTQDYWKRHHFN